METLQTDHLLYDAGYNKSPIKEADRVWCKTWQVNYKVTSYRWTVT